MSRWKVDRRVIHYPRRRAFWAACCDGKKRTFATWREAMTYADQRSRTIEVTLPPPETHPSDDVPGPSWHASENLVRPWVSTVGRSVWRTDHRGLGDFIDADSAEQLGLALLAAAEYTKENQCPR